MTDHANELRRYARKIAHPAGDVPAVMLAAADEIERLAARLEAAEKDSAHQKALAASALRVAEGWERKCGELRAKVEAMERQEPARLVTPTAYRWRYRGAIKWQYGELTEETVRLAKEHNHEVQALGILPDAQQCKNCNGTGDRFSDWPEYEPTWKAIEVRMTGAQPAPSVPDEPSSDWFDCLIADISSIPSRYHGDPSYDHDAYWMREEVIRMLEKRKAAAPKPEVK